MVWHGLTGQPYRVKFRGRDGNTPPNTDKFFDITNRHHPPAGGTAFEPGEAANNGYQLRRYPACTGSLIPAQLSTLTTYRPPTPQGLCRGIAGGHIGRASNGAEDGT